MPGHPCTRFIPAQRMHLQAERMQERGPYKRWPSSPPRSKLRPPCALRPGTLLRPGPCCALRPVAGAGCHELAFSFISPSTHCYAACALPPHGGPLRRSTSASQHRYPLAPSVASLCKRWPSCPPLSTPLSPACLLPPPALPQSSGFSAHGSGPCSSSVAGPRHRSPRQRLPPLPFTLGTPPIPSYPPNPLSSSPFPPSVILPKRPCISRPAPPH